MPGNPNDDSPARTRPRRADVRADVLDAAREVFSEFGYYRASVDLIASRAGFSKGAVYSNFASKDDLFFALLQDELEARAKNVAASGRQSADEPASVLAFAEAILALVRWQAAGNVVFAEFRAYASRDPDLAARLASVRGELTDSVAATIEAQVKRFGRELAVPAREAAILMLAVINGLALENIGHDEPAVSATTIAAVLSSLSRPSPAAPPNPRQARRSH